jgi:hypothetical protein
MSTLLTPETPQGSRTLPSAVEKTLSLKGLMVVATDPKIMV